MAHHISIPADVPRSKQREFSSNIKALTRNTGNIFLFVADHKIEHLNKDFYGTDIDPSVGNPEHLFRIAQAGDIGGFATHMGLLTRYALDYPKVNYIVKLTGKTNLISAAEDDPYSTPLSCVDDVALLKKQQKLLIRGIGITIYPGSMYEASMLEFAAQQIFEAHQHGLVAILWIYPRGKAVSKENDIATIAGAAGLAASLGADFVKVHPPEKSELQSSAQLLKQATQAAGNTALICSGGERLSSEQLIEQISQQMQIGKTRGCAVGRNLFQRPLNEAIALSKKLAAIVYRTREWSMQ